MTKFSKISLTKTFHINISGIEYLFSCYITWILPDYRWKHCNHLDIDKNLFIKNYIFKQVSFHPVHSSIVFGIFHSQLWDYFLSKAFMIWIIWWISIFKINIIAITSTYQTTKIWIKSKLFCFFLILLSCFINVSINNSSG